MIFRQTMGKMMNRATNDPNAIPCLVLTFSREEIESVNAALTEQGYEDDLKQWILDNLLGDEDEDGEGQSKYEGAADRVIHNVSDFVRENPDAVRAASALAGSFLNRVIKRGPLH